MTDTLTKTAAANAPINDTRKAELLSKVVEHVDITKFGALRRMRSGLRFVPEDRLGMGLIPELNIIDNLMLRDFRDGSLAVGAWVDLIGAVGPDNGPTVGQFDKGSERWINLIDWIGKSRQAVGRRRTRRGWFDWAAAERARVPVEPGCSYPCRRPRVGRGRG